MSKMNDREWLKSSSFEKTVQFNTGRRTECFTNTGLGFDKCLISNKTRQNGFGGLITRQTNHDTVKIKEYNHLFKLPSLPVTKTNVGSIKSPSRRVQSGRVTNDLKLNQQSKMSFLPRPSFINSRKSIHCARGSRLNSRKEVIQKMVFLAECALQENREIKQSTPVKTLAGLTPRKTPRPKGYLLLPDFKQIGMKLNLGTPIPKETKSEKGTPESFLKSEIIEEKSISNLESKEISTVKSPAPNKPADFAQMLRYCRIYNTEVGLMYGKLKLLEECFESNIKGLPDCEVYEEFCLYQAKKEELYEDLKLLEEKLKNSVKNQSHVGRKLKDYVKKRKELFDKRSKLHRDFEDVVKSAMEKCEKNERLEGDKEESKEELKEDSVKDDRQKMETPILRRSLRLSKSANRSSADEKTPMTKKLKKLDSKSKGIQRGRRLKSP